MPADHAQVAAKSRVNRLSFAVLLLFFRERGRFPLGSSEIDRQMVWEVAQQIHVPVREVVFPVVGEQTLCELVKEWKATGPTYRTTLRTVIRNSYKGHYRRMVPQILKTLDFRSDNRHHRLSREMVDSRRAATSYESSARSA